MARKRFHGLSKVKIRATWSKYNLYNFSRFKLPAVHTQTYFQQKWAAKSASRAFHGEHIREGQWQRMFTTRLPSVIPMAPKYLAQFDGSEQAAGRGSGKDRAPTAIADIASPKGVAVPYMHMTYAPLERRLDMAIWRSLFASSARQARQMVIHGHVKVNGQKMPYPGYLLNPGDMFQVEPDRVLFATGDTKEPAQAREGRRIRRVRTKENIMREEKRAEFRAKREATRAAKAVTEVEESTITKITNRPQLSRTEEEQRKEIRKQYQLLLRHVKKYLAEKTGMSAKRKQEARAYLREIKNAMGGVNNKKTSVKDLEATFTSINAQFARQTNYTVIPRESIVGTSKKEGGKSSTVKTAENKESAEDLEARFNDLGFDEQKAVKETMKLLRENPVDDSKPYATPWRPRPYMSPFAFIPRYLEVNQNVCSAVYLRHPVARPGMAEVPTPFGHETQQLVFNWYLKRR